MYSFQLNWFWTRLLHLCNVWLYICIFFIQIWVLVLIDFIFYDLGLSRLGFKHPTSCLRVDALAHCVTKAVFGIVIFSKHFNVFLLLVLVIFPTWNSLDMTLHFRVVNNPSPTLIDKNLRILSQTWRVKYFVRLFQKPIGV